MRQLIRRSRWCGLLTLSTLVMCASLVRATPYASNVFNTTGSTWQFVLNESSDNVTVLRNGGNAMNLGPLAAGHYTFDMTGFSSFDIKVQKSTPVAWTAISDATNKFTTFEQPRDVAVNTMATSPYFGTIYVNSDRAVTSGNGRVMGDGIYAMTADMKGVDLSSPNFAAVADPNDATQAKAPHWTNTGTVTDNSNPTTPVTYTSDASAYRMSLDAAGNVIVGDFSDLRGGVKYATRDLTQGGPLLIHEDGFVPLLGNSADGNSGPQVHGSMVSRPYTTGSVGNNLALYGIDEDMTAHGTGTDGNNLWKWTVGNVTNPNPGLNPTPPMFLGAPKPEFAGGYDQPPQLVVNVGKIPATTGATVASNFLNLNVGVLADAVYSPTTNKWYMDENRNGGGEAGLIVVTPDGVNGDSPSIDTPTGKGWSSYQFTIDNGLDGDNVTAGTQDVFRNIGGDLILSPDGKSLIVHRINGGGGAANTVLGPASNTPGAILIIPLDANGLPNLTVSGGQITNIKTISIASDTGNGTASGVTMDAAGNIYTTSNISELMQVFSPGGSFTATTSGTVAGGTSGFRLDPLVVAGVAGDYNGNGVVDMADYVLWRKGGPLQNDATPGVQATDYDVWRAHFGNHAGAGSSVGSGAAVPEPGVLSLALLGLLAVGGCRKRSA
jgi:hypothetical protein